MTILIPEAHDALADAVARRKAARGSRGVRRLWPRRSRRVTGAIVVAVAVVTGVALAATTGWHPVLGGEESGKPPVAARGPVPAEQLRAFAVLRRPQRDADRAPEVQAALRLLRGQDVNGIHVDAIRVLRRHADAVVILVPVERFGSRDVRDHVPVQRHALCLVGVSPAHWRFGPNATSTTAVPPRMVNAAVHCGDLGELRRTGILLGAANRIGGLVPDGVARVLVQTAWSGRVSAVVRENYYEVPSGGSLAAPGQTQWIGDDGHVVATFRPGR